MFAGGVEVYAHGIHATDHGLVETLFEAHLVHIVLVLPHPNALGVYLHQLCQRVHEPAADACGTTYGDVLVGKFFTGNLGGGVNGGAIFIDEEYGQAQVQLFDELVRFPACGAIAHGYGLYVVLLYQ